MERCKLCGKKAVLNKESICRDCQDGYFEDYDWLIEEIKSLGGDD